MTPADVIVELALDSGLPYFEDDEQEDQEPALEEQALAGFDYDAHTEPAGLLEFLSRGQERQDPDVWKIKREAAPEARARLRKKLDKFEQRYGIPSDRLDEAFRDEDGQLAETDDFHRWSMAHAMWQHLEEDADESSSSEEPDDELKELLSAGLASPTGRRRRVKDYVEELEAAASPEELEELEAFRDHYRRRRTERRRHELCQLQAAAIAEDPTLLEQAFDQLDRLEESADRDAWMHVLTAGPAACIGVLTSTHPEASALQADSPFAFVVVGPALDRARRSVSTALEALDVLKQAQQDADDDE